MLTEEQVAAYREDGFILVPDVYSADEIAELNRVSDRFVETSRALTESDGVFDIGPGHSHATPKFTRGSKPIKFFVDAAFLPQNLSTNLSNDCAHGKINTKRPGRYYMEVEFQSGRKKGLGYANSLVFNLRAPNNKKAREIAFLFDLDGTCQYRVFALPTMFCHRHAVALGLFGFSNLGSRPKIVYYPGKIIVGLATSMQKEGAI